LGDILNYRGNSHRGEPPAWAVVIVHSGTEEMAERAFRHAGHRVCIVWRRELRWPHGQEKTPGIVLVPAWPGYVFVQDWAGWPRETVTGAIGLMERQGERVELTTADIAQFVEWSVEGQLDDGRIAAFRRRRRIDLSVGDRVAFTRLGRRFEGKVERLSKNGQALVRELLQGWPIELDAAALEKATA